MHGKLEVRRVFDAQFRGAEDRDAKVSISICRQQQYGFGRSARWMRAQFELKRRR